MSPYRKRNVNRTVITPTQVSNRHTHRTSTTPFPNIPAESPMTSRAVQLLRHTTTSTGITSCYQVLLSRIPLPTSAPSTLRPVHARSTSNAPTCDAAEGVLAAGTISTDTTMVRTRLRRPSFGARWTVAIAVRVRAIERSHARIR
jgi:hypothetical protein